VGQRIYYFFPKKTSLVEMTKQKKKSVCLRPYDRSENFYDTPY
jgi:hypothetical protein